MNELEKPMLEGYSININQILNNAWNRFKSDSWVFLGMGVVFFLINILVSSIPVISLASNFTSVILFSGYFIYCRNMDSKTNTPRDFWGGLKYSINLFLYQLTLIILIFPLLIISLSSIIPFETFIDLMLGNTNVLHFSESIQQNIEDVSTNIVLGIFLVSGLAIYLNISFLFAPILIVDSKLGFWYAMELSRKTIGKQFFTFLIFWIIFVIAMGIGTIITFGIGLFFFTPFMYLIIFEMYNSIFTTHLKTNH
jgi:hypothetical protein